MKISKLECDIRLFCFLQKKNSVKVLVWQSALQVFHLVENIGNWVAL